MRLIILLFFYLLAYNINAQIGIGTTNPEASSKLDISSPNKGFLPPRMSTAQRDAINGGVFAEGLVVYNTDDNCLNFYNGSAWVNLCDNSGGTPPPLPGNIVLTGGQKAYIASVYDNDYLPYTAPTTAADTGSLDANGSPDNLVNIQGVLTTSGITVSIPYTVTTAAVTLPAFSQTKTVITDYVQGSNPLSNEGGGTPVDVVFSYDTVTLNPGSGTITATIKAVGSDLNAVKLDINKGIGTDLGLLLASFTMALDDAGNIDTVKLIDIPGIPDRRFGDETVQNSVLGQYHNNLYLPVKYNGKIWLNNNLGANYANVNHPHFNIAQQAKTPTDSSAYGSNYQWGRFSDGHELITITSSTSLGFLNAPTASKGDTFVPGHNQFINGGGTPPHNWMTVNPDNLWQGTAGINNPCPQGFRVPTQAEWLAYANTLTPNTELPATFSTPLDNSFWLL
jgi:uncharacterized protein (TIGR02145 family)